MRFHSISITNLFSYCGTHTLHLDNNENCNITVLVGRNGFGKTSFINSVKMLFIGEAEEIRRTVQRKRTPTEKQFVDGISNEWWGILNKQAKSNGDRVCSVEADWTDDEGFRASVKRQWDLSRSHESVLLVGHEMRGELDHDEARKYLEHIMPKSFLPFFFFDGEEVQAIAEANDNEIIKKMELLLNIRPLENMQTILSELAKGWKTKGQSQAATKELNDKERELTSKADQEAVFLQTISDLETDIEELSEQLKKIDRNLRWLRGGVSHEAELKLKISIANKESQREEKLEALASAWKSNAVLAMHPVLLKKAINKLEGLIHSNQGEQEELIRMIKQRLENLFSMPPFPEPKLSNSQMGFYNKRILKELDAAGVMECIEGSYDVSHDLGKKIFNQLNQYSGSDLLNSLNQETSTAQSLWKKIHDENNKLKATGKLSQDKQIEYQELLQQESELGETIRDKETRKHIAKKELATLKTDMEKISNQLKIKMNALNIATEFRKQHDFAERLKGALNEVKSRLKSTKREELENAYNKHLKCLLDSHSLVDKVVIDDNFEISYLDNQGDVIGMSTVSAGMKQLSATALLWALKDISGRDFPIIIDTPMGRIDAKHQENLLKKYYPHVGKQVILLPTDSELNERKYNLLKPHICKVYELKNPTGSSTSIQPKEY